MRMSALFLRTLRDDPADAEVDSHRLLVRAGYIRRVSSGIYSWLPLGNRVLRKVAEIVRQEMDDAGAQEVDLVLPFARLQRGDERAAAELLRAVRAACSGLVLKVILPRWKDDDPGALPEVPSVSGVWPTADWHEREVYDLSGVWFTDHPDLRRILCPEDWIGHPLRKDYEMPLEYHGIRGR